MIRGVAATMVFVCHLIGKNPYLNSKTYLAFISNWGTEAVMIFFILSGIVINITQTKKPTTRSGFLKNRLLRIYPIYLVGIIAAYLLNSLLFRQSTNIAECIANIFFLGTLQGHIAAVPAYNNVVWSLSFEMFFYLLFAVSISAFQKKIIFVWTVLALICIPFYYLQLKGLPGYLIAMMAFSSIWLVGYYIYEYRNYFTCNQVNIALIFLFLLPGISRINFTHTYYDPAKYLLFAITAIPVFIFALGHDEKACKIESPKLHFSIYHALTLFGLMCAFLLRNNSMLISKLIYVSFPLIGVIMFLLNVKFKRLPSERIKKASIRLGSISYAVYMIHFPIVILFANFTHQHFILYIISTLISVLLAASFLEYKYQPFVVKLIKG